MGLGNIGSDISIWPHSRHCKPVDYSIINRM